MAGLYCLVELVVGCLWCWQFVVGMAWSSGVSCLYVWRLLVFCVHVGVAAAGGMGLWLDAAMVMDKMCHLCGFEDSGHCCTDITKPVIWPNAGSQKKVAIALVLLVWVGAHTPHWELVGKMGKHVWGAGVCSLKHELFWNRFDFFIAGRRNSATKWNRNSTIPKSIFSNRIFWFR